MPLVDRFENLDAWKKARELRKEGSALARRPEFRHDTDLRSQLRRAGLSVMSNIAEGFERSGLVQFRNFVNIAKASAGEVRSELYAALDDGLIRKSDFDRVYALAHSAGRLCGGLLRSLQARIEAQSRSRSA